MAIVLGLFMRYHKATAICKVEADFIADTSLFQDGDAAPVLQLAQEAVGDIPWVLQD